eukprot:6467403-Amphidinium_carterae.1
MALTSYVLEPSSPSAQPITLKALKDWLRKFSAKPMPTLACMTGILSRSYFVVCSHSCNKTA